MPGELAEIERLATELKAIAESLRSVAARLSASKVEGLGPGSETGRREGIRASLAEIERALRRGRKGRIH